MFYRKIPFKKSFVTRRGLFGNVRHHAVGKQREAYGVALLQRQVGQGGGGAGREQHAEHGHIKPEAIGLDISQQVPVAFIDFHLVLFSSALAANKSARLF